MAKILTYKGKPLFEGDKIKDFRGEEWEFVRITDDGSIYVKRTDQDTTRGTISGDFYPQVFPGLEEK